MIGEGDKIVAWRSILYFKCFVSDVSIRSRDAEYTLGLYPTNLHVLLYARSKWDRLLINRCNLILRSLRSADHDIERVLSSIPT